MSESSHFHSELSPLPLHVYFSSSLRTELKQTSNTMGHLITSRSSGEISAILTVVEFIIGGLALFCLPFLSSKVISLCFQTENNEGRQNASKQVRVWIRILSFIIAASFTACVAIIETNMVEDPLQHFAESAVNTTHWVRMGEDTNSVTKKWPVIPNYIYIERMSVLAARTMGCEGGIESIAIGIIKINRILPYIYPNCNSEKQNFSTEHSYRGSKFTQKFNSSGALVEEYLTPNNRKTWSTLFPYPSNNFSFEYQNFITQDFSACSQKNISIISKDEFSNTDGHRLYVNDFNDNELSAAVFQKICEQLDDSQPALGEDNITDLQECVQNIQNDTALTDGVDRRNTTIVLEKAVNYKCLHRKLSETSIRNVIRSSEFSGLGTIISRRSKDGVVCTDASVKFTHATVPYRLLTGLPSSMNVIVPLKYEVVSGVCEQTFEELGLFSIAFASIAEWFPTEVGKLGETTRHQRYYGYMMQIARNNFHYDDIFDQPRKEILTFGIYKGAVIFLLDPTFYILLFIISICCLIIIGTLILFIFSWKDLDIHEYLNELRRHKKKKKIDESTETSIETHEYS